MNTLTNTKDSYWADPTTQILWFLQSVLNMKTNMEINLKQPTPILRIFDEAKAKEFYIDYLGFSINWEHRFGDGMPLYMQVTRKNCTLHLSEHHGDGTPGTILRIECDEVEAYYKELLTKNYKKLNPGIEERPWAEKEMQLKDPFGNELRIFKAK